MGEGGGCEKREDGRRRRMGRRIGEEGGGRVGGWVGQIEGWEKEKEDG